MICGLSHLIGVAHDTLRDQVYEIGFFQALVVAAHVLTMNEVFDLEKLIPNIDESLFGHAVTNSTVFVNDLLNFLDNLLDHFNFDNLLSDDWLFNNSFNGLDSIFVNNDLLL